MSIRKICVVVGSRANYSSIKSVLNQINSSSFLELQIVLCGSAVLERYGNVAKLIEKDGFSIAASLDTLIEGETPATMSKSVGLGLIELSSLFERISPDIVLTIGDRFETMSTVIATTFNNILLAHTMGGEVTGTIDESIRHAVTKFSHIHFAASKDAVRRILKLGEIEQNVHLVGCPRIDLVKSVLDDVNNHESILSQSIFHDGVGAKFDLKKPFLIVSQHPVTTEFELAESQMNETLEAVREIKIPVIALWPNADAGSGGVSLAMRKFREKFNNLEFHYFKNLPISVYILLMSKTSCLIGNSSSAIREGCFIGTPSVNIGSRQNSRERGKNVIDVPHEKNKILNAIYKQIEHGHYPRENLYGDGFAAERIVKVLQTASPKIQKTITY